MKQKLLSIVSILTILPFAIGPVTAQHLHPKLKKKEKQIRSVLILPAKVELTKTGMKGGEGMMEESENVAEALPGLVAAALQKQGFTVLESPFTSENLDGNNLRFILAEIQNSYDVLGQQLHRKPKDVKKGRFTLGDEVTKVNADGRADVLVFIRAAGNKNTGGKKAFAIFTLNAAMLIELMTISISLVDAESGEILATTRAIGTGDFVNKTDKALSKSIEKSLKKLPPPPRS